MIHGPGIPGPWALLLPTASDFTLTTSHSHNRALFSLWPRLFVPSGASSPLFSRSILGAYRPGELLSQYPVFLSLHAVHGVLKARRLKRLPFPSPVDHVLSEPCTMTRPSWVAPHSVALSFTELDQAVVHVVSLGSFL